jgi:hypothetical protein
VKLCLVIGLFSTARGQDHERSLVDRLLKPDTTLQTKAQNKQILAEAGQFRWDARFFSEAIHISIFS